MKTMQYKGKWFRGQYAKALEKLLNGEAITVKDFYAGAWEPTHIIRSFMSQLDSAGINYVNEGESLRTSKIRRV